jgi:hypothetical protein
MWRELARRSVPWQQWTIDQKEAAHQDYQSALRRQRNESERLRFYEEDNELFKLLQPYKSDLRDFYTKHTTTMMYGDDATSPSVQIFVSPFSYEAPYGDKLTWTVDVRVFDDTSSRATGEVLFEIFTTVFPERQVDLKRVPLKDGRAVYTTIVMPKGKYRVRARYQPLNTGNISSESEVRLTIL